MYIFDGCEIGGGGGSSICGFINVFFFGFSCLGVLNEGDFNFIGGVMVILGVGFNYLMVNFEININYGIIVLSV